MKFTKIEPRYVLELSSDEFHDLRALFAAGTDRLDTAFSLGSLGIEKGPCDQYATYDRHGLIAKMRELRP
jgi:hypothetical protein